MHTRLACFASVFSAGILALTVFGANNVQAATLRSWDAGDGNGSTAWYTSANWDPNTASGAWATDDTARFNNAGTATTAGINMGTASLAIGAIEVTSARTKNLTVFNSSGTGGTLTLHGVANTILQNASGNTLTLNNGSSTMGLVLPSVGNNKIVQDGGLIAINISISGVGGIEVIRNAGASRVDLGGNNSYAGNTVITSGRIRITSSAGNGIPNGENTGNVMLGVGTILQMVTATETINGLSGSGVIDTDANPGVATTLTVGDWNQTSTFDGTIVNNSDKNNAANVMNVIKIGSGVLTLNGNNTYSGTTQINAGTLLVNGDHFGTIPLTGGPINATGAYTVNDGGTLGGFGSTGGMVTVNDGGTISPGASAGMLTVGGLSAAIDSSFAFDLDPNDETPGDNFNDNDLIAVTNALTLVGDVNLDVQDSVNPGDFDGIGTWTLITFDSLTGFAPGVYDLTTGVNVTGLDLGVITSYSILANVGAGGNGNITLTTVPEPNALILASIGVLGLGWSIRRKRK